MSGNGAASYISRLLGHGNKENADKVASTALYSSISTGAVIIIISMVFLQHVLKLLGATRSILPYAITYNGILYAQPVADVLSAIITVLMAIPLHKKLNEMQKQSTSMNTDIDK